MKDIKKVSLGIAGIGIPFFGFIAFFSNFKNQNKFLKLEKQNKQLNIKNNIYELEKIEANIKKYDEQKILKNNDQNITEISLENNLKIDKKNLSNDELFNEKAKFANENSEVAKSNENFDKNANNDFEKNFTIAQEKINNYKAEFENAKKSSDFDNYLNQN